MKLGIGLTMGGHRYDGGQPAPRWDDIRTQARTAEAAGFDLAVLDDAIVDGGEGTWGYWDAMTLGGAVCASTSTIRISHSMVNAPLRPAAVVANAATTLDEISGGRYTLGMGAGNTPGDYEAFGIASDRRYSRLAEKVAVIHSLLRTREVAFDGEFEHAHGTLEPAGPRPEGPRLAIAAWKPKMIALAARYADEWNGFTTGPPTFDAYRPMLDELALSCEAIDRDPAGIRRSLDVPVDAHHLVGRPAHEFTRFVVHGSPEQMAEQLLAYEKIGIDEIRCRLWPDPPTGTHVAHIEAMAEVVDLVHGG